MFRNNTMRVAALALGFLPLAAASAFAGSFDIAAFANERRAHTASLLTSGNLLIAGGELTPGNPTNIAELWQTGTNGNRFLLAGSLNVPRASHTATVMPDGRVIITGGNNGPGIVHCSIEIYDPATNAFTPGGNMSVPRYNHTATLLNTGDVLICGGQTAAVCGGATTGLATNSCDLIDPNGLISGIVGMQQARMAHTAVALKDGKVWFAGGLNPSASPNYLLTTERYDPAGSFNSALPLIQGRAYHTATMMGDGKVFIAGGFNGRDQLASRGFLETTEIYDPVSNSLIPGPPMVVRRMGHSSTLLANGEIAMYGGLGNFATNYFDASATLLANSSVTATYTGGVNAISTSTINGGSLRINIDRAISPQISGVIQAGEIRMSSPSVNFGDGVAYFAPYDPGTGLRIDLAGVPIRCSAPPGGGAATCGRLVGNFTTTGMSGNLIMFPRALTISNNPTVDANFASFITFTNSPLAPTETGQLTGGNIYSTVTISMPPSVIGARISSGTVIVDAGSLTMVGDMTVAITGARINIPVNTPIVSDGVGGAMATFFAPLVPNSGLVTNSSTTASFSSPRSIPIRPPPPGLTIDGLGGSVRYAVDYADLADMPFVVDVATIVIHSMHFGDQEYYVPRTNTVGLLSASGERTPGTVNGRSGHTTTLLPSNDLVHVGGSGCAIFSATANVCGSFGVVDGVQTGLIVTADTFAGGATIGTRRAFHTSTLLADGRILVAGGTNGPNILRGAEIFDPVSNTFSPTATPMVAVRDLHTATLLPNGRVLLAGGFTTNATSTGSTNTAEIYYPDTRVFMPTPPMTTSRSNHVAVTLPDGNVMVIGGFGPNDVITNTVEIFYSTAGVWRSAPDMPTARALHTATIVKNGSVYVLGGVGPSGIVASVDVFNTVTGGWTTLPGGDNMPGGGVRSHSATQTFDGRILVAGGNDGFGEADFSYYFDPNASAGSRWLVTGTGSLLTQPRFNHTATLLPNGTVMISGGSRKFGQVPNSIEVFRIGFSSWAPGSATFQLSNRAFHTMTLGLNNNIYAIGGSDGVIGGVGTQLLDRIEQGYFTAYPDSESTSAPATFRQSTVTAHSASPFLENTLLTATGLRFRGATEASGGGAASANSSFNMPQMVLQRVEGSNGGGTQSDAGFVVDLTTQIYVNMATSGQFGTFDTSVTAQLPLTKSQLPYGWYALRMGANDVYSEGTMLQAGPPKTSTSVAALTGTPQGISSVTWNWTFAGPIAPAVGGIDGFNVYSATTGVLIGTTPAAASASFSQVGLAPGATATVFVAPFSLTGDGPLTPSATVYSLPQTPLTPYISSVTFSTLLLQWGQNFNSSGTVYEITQSTDGFVTSFSTPVPTILGVTTNQYVINNLQSNTNYSFRVRAFNLAGLPSSFSGTVSTLTRTSVSGLTGVALDTTRIQWSWVNPGGVISYGVYNAVSGVLIASGASVMSNLYIERNLSTNTVHSVAVTAVTGAGEGPLSPSATAYTLAAIPTPNSPAIVALSTGSLVLSWTNNGNPLGTTYFVQLFDLLGSTVAIGTNTTTGFTAGFGELDPSRPYELYIEANNFGGVGTPAQSIASTYTLPTAPANLRALDRQPSSITIGWDDTLNSSVIYQVTYTSATSFDISVATPIPFSLNYTSTSTVITGLATSTTYSIRIVARNPLGAESVFSNTITTDTFNGGAAVGSLAGPLLTTSDSVLVGSIGGGRQIRLRAPANSFTSNVTATVSSYNVVGTLCPNGVNAAVNITIAPALQPIKGLYLTMSYTNPELGSITPSRAVLMRYDPQSNTCVPLETWVDTANNLLTARINHFSLFQIASVPLATNVSNARLFPNPYMASRDGYVTLDRVPPGAKVKVFTMRGEKVLETTANSNGILTWSGTNGFGRAVASGLYVIHVEGEGTTKIMKLAVLR